MTGGNRHADMILNAFIQVKDKTSYPSREEDLGEETQTKVSFYRWNCVRNT